MRTLNTRPIRSVLAARKMFANGGMVVPAASGILASSQPLMQAAGQREQFPQPMDQQGQFSQPMGQQGQSFVDSVTQDALNPQGGGTLSMEEGGVARFQDGGSNSQRIQLGLGAAPEAIERRYLATPRERSQEIFPYESGLTGGFIGPQPLLQEDRTPRSPLEKFVRSPLQAIDQLARILSQGNAIAGRAIEDFGQTVITTQHPDVDHFTHFSQIRVVNQLLRRMPRIKGVHPNQIAEEIHAAAKELQANDPTISGENLAEQISERVYGKYEAELGFEQVDMPAFVEAEEAIGGIDTAEPPAAIEPGGDIDLGLATPDEIFDYTKTEGPEPAPTDDDDWGAEAMLEDAVAGIGKIPFKGSEDYGTLTKYLAGGGQEDAPAAVVNKAADDIFATALKAAKGEKFDAVALKTEIDALLPRTKDNPEMEGLLIAMIGAAIMGGESPNAWTNIGQGVAKALPALINFKGKQAEAERARDMTVAKLAIETKLSRETENRANIRGIEREQRAATNAERVAARKEAAAIRTANRKTKMYTVLKPATISLNEIDPEAPEGETFTIPALFSIPLNEASAKRLSGLGVSIASGVKIDYDDIVTDNTKVSGLSGMTTKQINDLTRNEKMTVFKFGTAPGAQIYFRTPREAGVRTGLATEDAMQPGMWKKLYSAYRTYQDPLMVLYGRFDTLKQYVNADGSLSDDGKSKVTGYRVIKERIGDKLKGMGFSWSKNLGTALLGGKKQSTISKFEAEARIVLAQIAPLYLGESGRTISDADRIRVALALGFKVDQDLAGRANPILKITGFDDAFFTNPDAITNALNVTQGIVRRYINDGNNEMAGYLNQFSRLLDTDPKLRRTIPKPSDLLVFNATI